MSKIALTPNASGTGTFTIASPNSNTDRTLTLPDVAGEVVVNEGSGTFKIDSSGNVGVGTSSPSYPLHVNGRISYSGAIGEGADTTLSSFSTTVIHAASSTWQNQAFYTGGTERLRIDSSGKIAAGGTTTNGRLTISEAGLDTGVSLGNAAIMTYGAYGGGIAFVDSSNPSSGTGYLCWVDAFGNDFNIAKATTSSAPTGGVYINNSAGSWSSRSDERDKINLEPIVDAASKVQSLRAVTGEYIWAEGVRHPFLIAQDVQAVLPEAVNVANKSAPEEDQRLGMSYTDMVPLLTAALQEALEEIESLKARIDVLEAKP